MSRSNFWIRAFLIFWGLGGFSPLQSWSAPCCGGSAAAPAWISGDDRMQAGMTVSRSSVIGDAPEHGVPVFRSSSSSETTSTTRLDFATLLTDRLQASITGSIMGRSIRTPQMEASHSSIGDLSTGLAYEAWPEWSYSVWKPRGYVFGQLQIPIARSIYDATETAQIDALGSGFFRITAGALLLKTHQLWDFSVMPEIQRALPRTFGSLRVEPRWGATVALSAGYNLSKQPVRFGFRIQPIWNEGRSIESDSGIQTSSAQLSWNTGADASYLITEAETLAAHYTDQTILGPAVNSTLSRTLAISYQHRWTR